MTIPEFYQHLLYGCCCLLRVALQHYVVDMYSLCYASAAVLVCPY